MFEVFRANVRGFGNGITPATDSGWGLRAGGVLIGTLPVSPRWSVGPKVGLRVPIGSHDTFIGEASAWSEAVGYDLGLELRHAIF